MMSSESQDRKGDRLSIWTKLASAFATSLALQMLGWFEYQSPPVDATQFTQTPRALSAIRFLIGPMEQYCCLHPWYRPGSTR